MQSLIPLMRRACDMAASAVMPPSMVTSNYVEASAAGEPYLIRCAPNANKLILYLHTWSATYQQVTTMPEFPSIERACIVSPNFGGVNNTPLALGSDDSLARILRVLQEVQYKTGLSRVYIVAASGGTLAAMNFMGKYPGRIHRASLWLPIFDLALLYSHTSDLTLKADMVSSIGAAPNGLSDALYLARSPVSRLVGAYGPTEIVINTGSGDTTSPPIHGTLAKQAFEAGEDFIVTLKSWSIGHVFDSAQRSEAVKQLVLE
jgi:pimeloyl-ACP methyl ester carboxylesterase